MSQQSRNETTFQPQQQPVLCANNCGFFGNPSTLNFCSKCYKEQQAKQQPAATQESKIVAASPAEAAETESPVAETSEKVQQTKKNRCFSCNRKVGVLGFECRCDYVFCGEHRYPHTHNCGVSVKNINRAKLETQNPKVQNDKFEKI